MNSNLPVETVDHMRDEASGLIFAAHRYANGRVTVWVVDPTYPGRSTEAIPDHEWTDARASALVRRLVAADRCHGIRADGSRCRQQAAAGYCRHHVGQVTA